MRKLLVVGALGAIAAVHVACSSDDTVVGAPTGQGGSGGAGGKEGTGGTAGSAGSKASGAGGGGGAAGAAGTGNGGGGAGGGAGSGGDGGMGGTGGTNIVDPCAGKYSPLPLAVSSAFTTLRICSAGTCTSAVMPYYFAPIPNPNCDETFPDGGIVPPFADAGVEGGTPADTDAGDAGGGDGSDATSPVADANDAGVTDGAAATDAGVAAEAGVAADADAGSADATAAVDATSSGDAVADVSLGTDARAEASPEAAPGDGGAPSCYEFLYNPACTTGTCWGGVIFTQSAGGSADPGVCIEQGATKISFKAKASRAGARIKFGSTREGLGATEFFMNITTEWATYEVTLPPGEPYNSYSAGGTGVWNGFSVIVEPQDHPGGTYIFVKDAVWMK